MARVAEGPREHAQSSDIPACRKSGSVSRSSARITGPMRCRSPASDGYQVPTAAVALQDVGEILRATDRHHAPEFGELDRVDAGGQGEGRAEGAILVTRSAEPGQPSGRHLGRVGAIGHYWCKLRSGPGWPLAARPDVLRMVFRNSDCPRYYQRFWLLTRISRSKAAQVAPADRTEGGLSHENMACAGNIGGVFSGR